MESSKHHLQLPLSKKASVIYHDIFDYPLTLKDLSTWQVNNNYATKIATIKKKIQILNTYVFLSGREYLIKKRNIRERESKDKLVIVNKSTKLLKLLPSIKFIGITGSLAMLNADISSDIDLMIVTKKNTLWVTRLLVYLLLIISGIKIRKPNIKEEKDKLCLNIWLEENNLEWKDKNIFTAHEILQIVPVFNKTNTYEKLLFSNNWVTNYWINPIIDMCKKPKIKIVNENRIINFLIYLINYLAFKFQYHYMRKKITKETITINKALFHPLNESVFVEKKLYQNYDS